jgi:hypothetical protein
MRLFMLRTNRMSKLNLAAVATALALLSCNNPKAVNKANFKAAIQVALDKHSECLPISLPNEPRSMFDAKPRTDPQLDAVVMAGLASQKRVMMENSGWSLSGGPKQILGPHYEFTAEGRKYAAHPEHSALPVGAKTLCYGVPEVIEVERYSEPGNAFGQTMTAVTYTYALKSVPVWSKDATLMQQFPELTRIPTRDHPLERSMDLVLMSDGWRVASLGF